MHECCKPVRDAIGKPTGEIALKDSEMQRLVQADWVKLPLPERVSAGPRSMLPYPKKNVASHSFSPAEPPGELWTCLCQDEDGLKPELNLQSPSGFARLLTTSVSRVDFQHDSRSNRLSLMTLRRDRREADSIEWIDPAARSSVS